jgi:ubiquinone/menaquinone biosynthesis C-methylase UbiE
MNSSPAVDKQDPAYAGQAMYSRSLLLFYDAVIFGFSCPVVWRCPKKKLVDMYTEHVGERHLDIGVGTGRLLYECAFPTEKPQITLMDMNPNSLAAASRRLKRYQPATHQGNVLEPWGVGAGSFDSVGMCHLLHCLPGMIPEKVVAFDHARQALAPGGTLFGATICGQGVRHTNVARRALKSINRRGEMHNLQDKLEDIEQALASRFAMHEVTAVGSSALFWARTEA